MLRVFLVDDEELIIEELLKIIDWQTLGYEICGWSTDSIKALKEINEKKPHILITDINMNNLNGFELVSKVVENIPDIGVILLTAYDLFDYAIEAIKLRVLSYLVKPVNKNSLNGTLKDFRIHYANQVFQPFFEMVIEKRVEERIIKKLENNAKEMGFVKENKDYVFAFFEKDIPLENVVAKYKTEKNLFVLLETGELDEEEPLPFIYGVKFQGVGNLYKYAKETVILLDKLKDDEKTEKDIEIAVKQIIADIEENYAQKSSLDFYARKYHYNLCYLSQQFKLYVGVNFLEYIIEVRIKKAKAFMKEDTLSMIKIAERVGYDDYSHFSKLFKKREGCSPIEYRKKYC